MELLADIPQVWRKVLSLFDTEARGKGVPSVLLDTVIAECVSAKRFANLRKVYTDELERFLTRFCDSIGNPPIDRISSASLQDWLAKAQWSNGTRATGMNRLSALFAFAERRGYVERNPVDRIDRIRLERLPPRILSPAESKRLLDLCAARVPKLLPNVVIALFGGVRPAELDKLNWSDVDVARGVIRIDAAASKVRRRRIVKLEPVALEWLKTVSVSTGTVTPNPKRRALRRLRSEMGWDEWPKDVLRHSAASYLMAKYENAPMVADRLGNSPGILLTHYRELVSAEDCALFWSIKP